jgi:hypothetical protein
MKSMTWIGAGLIVTLVLGGGSSAHAEPGSCNGPKLTPSDGAEDDKFGTVSISGDIAVIGASGDDDQGGSSGSAYIFARDMGGPDNWGQVTKLTASDGVAVASFGISVSVSNDVAVIGAWRAEVNGTPTGAAYVFHRDHGGPDAWGEVVKLVAPDATFDDQFGQRVSVSGDVVVVGAWLDDDDGTSSGSAYVFHRHQGGSDNWGFVKKLTAPDGTTGDAFGRVAVGGDVLIVGANGDDDNGMGSGSAYVFHRHEGGVDNWGLVRKLTADDGEAGDVFGNLVAVDGDTIVVGATGDGGFTGAVYVFRRNEGGLDNWGQVAKLAASDGEPSDGFSLGLSISGDFLVVGANHDDDNGTNAGAAYVFARDDDDPDNWNEAVKLTAFDGADVDVFGASVAVSGDIALVGARLDNDNGDDSGSAYVYDLPGCLCPADVSGDSVVGVTDLTFVILAWGQAGGAADINADSVVDVLDLVEVITNWGPCP